MAGAGHSGAGGLHRVRGPQPGGGQALGNVSRIVSHTYGVGNRNGLRKFVASHQEPMWMTEYGDGDGGGLTMGQRIHDDLAVSWFQAWVYWQVLDNASGWGFLCNSLLAPTNANYTPNHTLNQRFYVMAQFSQFIRSGCRFISVNDSRSLAAIHPPGGAHRQRPVDHEFQRRAAFIPGFANG